MNGCSCGFFEGKRGDCHCNNRYSSNKLSKELDKRQEELDEKIAEMKKVKK